ncbi:MAG: DUF3576 domain-containing protein [Rickettsiales bacterium]|nr:DUF3576 domain-containing protein [Rickettsiales bacterium]MCA0254870.1 DUF3576 domain-containing protein [Pseudomonadota bacterium]
MNLKSIFSLFLLVGTSFYSTVLASDYPQTKIEREMEEMGSILGGEGITFRPNKERSTSTRSKVGNINKYLYQATIEVLKFTPLASVDSKAGVIITEWYTPKDQSNAQFKVTVYIKDDLITPEGIEVIAFERKKMGNKWSQENVAPSVSKVLEGKIIRKARDLYLQSAR